MDELDFAISLLEDRNISSEYELFDKYKGRTDVYFSYRNIAKVGINPLSTYQTPNGVYCYSCDMYKRVEDIPFRVLIMVMYIFSKLGLVFIRSRVGSILDLN